LDLVADRMVCSNGVRSRRLKVIGVDSDEEGCANLERFVGEVGRGSGEREDLEEVAMEGVVQAGETEGDSELTAMREDTIRRGLETAELVCDVTRAAAMWE
jgi:hypothetical protein